MTLCIVSHPYNGLQVFLFELDFLELSLGGKRDKIVDMFSTLQ